MIEISEPLPGSEPGYKSLHEVRLDGKYIGYIDVGYMRKGDIKMFKGIMKGKLKRELKIGQPFGVQLFIDSAKSGVSASELGEGGIRKILEVMRSKFEGLEDRDVSILELNIEKKKILGRADKFQVR